MHAIFFVDNGQDLPVHFNRYWPVLSTSIIYKTSFFYLKWSVFFLIDNDPLPCFSSKMICLYCRFRQQRSVYIVLLLTMISLFRLFHRHWSLYFVIFIDINQFTLQWTVISLLRPFHRSKPDYLSFSSTMLSLLHLFHRQWSLYFTFFIDNDHEGAE